MLRKLILFQGWCKFYEFSDGDLRAGQELLARLHERAGAASGAVDWDLVHGLCESAIYGGRVDDAHDIKILRSYLEASFNQSVASGGGGLVGFDSLPSEPDVRKYLDLVGRMPEEDKQVALQALRIRSISGADRGRSLTLGRAPRVLRRELRFDAETIAAKGSGHDPDWERKVG